MSENDTSLLVAQAVDAHCAASESVHPLVKSVALLPGVGNIVERKLQVNQSSVDLLCGVLEVAGSSI